LPASPVALAAFLAAVFALEATLLASHSASAAAALARVFGGDAPLAPRPPLHGADGDLDGVRLGVAVADQGVGDGPDEQREPADARDPVLARPERRDVVLELGVHPERLEDVLVVGVGPRRRHGGKGTPRMAAVA
jgi:hypothetical protein